MRTPTLIALVCAPLLFLAIPAASADAQYCGNRYRPSCGPTYYYGGSCYTAPRRHVRRFAPRRFVNRIYRPVVRNRCYTYSYPRYRTYRRSFRRCR